MSRTRVLIVEDEPELRNLLLTSLNGYGYQTAVATDGLQAIERAGAWKPDLIILDLGLPGLGGLEVCRLLRAWSQVPIVVLSVQNDDQTKVAALDLGADDYVTKPFSMSELLARLRVAARHAGAQGGPAVGSLRFGELSLDLVRRQVTLGGQELRLTRTEYDLLVALARRAGSVMTYEQLLREVWKDDEAADVRTLRVFLGQVRRKIGDDPTSPRFIFTETGIGYRFRPLPEDLAAP
ncbi:MAG TPA: response regulator transcription factor [Chloroflexaceae bacterium]|nr:response regulator transcription factor [Chloroflexaceae bacterium]